MRARLRNPSYLEMWNMTYCAHPRFSIFFFLIYFLASESLYKNYCNFLSGKQRRLGVSIMFKWPYYWDMETQKSEARGDYLITMMLVVLMLVYVLIIACFPGSILAWGCGWQAQTKTDDNSKASTCMSVTNNNELVSVVALLNWWPDWGKCWQCYYWWW